MSLWGRIDGVEKLRGNGVAGSSSPHGKEEIIVGVRAEVCHGLVVILGVEGDTARGEVGDGPVGSHNPHPQHMLSSTTVKRINYLWDPTDRANHK